MRFPKDMVRFHFWLLRDLGRLARPIEASFRPYTVLASAGNGAAPRPWGKRRKGCGMVSRSLIVAVDETSTTPTTTTNSTTTKQTQNDRNNYRESIEAVFVFHRHGDRTPGKPLVAEEFVNQESLFWKTKIPPLSCHELLSRRFPIVHQSNDRKVISKSKNSSYRETSGGNDSYGFLTWKGLHQMYHNGVAMDKRYGPRGGDAMFRDYWDVQAFSTNYLRTVMSCQAFLDGLLSNSNKSFRNDILLDYEYPTHYERIDPDGHQTRSSTAKNDNNSNGTSINTNNNNNSGGSTDSLEICVRDSRNETLNAFDTSRELMKKLVGNVFATQKFIENDRQASSLCMELSEYLPGLSKHPSYGEGKVPSGIAKRNINWIHAADHFVCRSSHAIPVDEFLEKNKHHNDDDKSQRFHALKRATLTHLRRRFHCYYSNPSLLGEMAGPALSEVALEMKQVMQEHIAVTTTSSSLKRSSNFGSTTFGRKKKKPFRVYSCHDVTILAFLYAIRDKYRWADRTIFDHKDNGSPLESSWPSYATCLTLELVRLEKQKNENNDEREKTNNDEDSSFLVKAWLNEAPIPEFVSFPVAMTVNPGAEPVQAITLAEFDEMVHELNLSRISNNNM